MAYVYRYRGTARYASVREYVRKAWPIFAPLNCMLYVFTEKRARRVFMDLREFPELNQIQAQWTTIRDEALALQAAGYFNKAKDPDTPAYFDVGFRTFFKYGWSRFYLNWYGHTHESALALCPKTVEILSRVRSVNGAMFSLLPPGGQLTRHIDPLAISLRVRAASERRSVPSAVAIGSATVMRAIVRGEAMMLAMHSPRLSSPS